MTDDWRDAQGIAATDYLCGYRGNQVGSNMGFLATRYWEELEILGGFEPGGHLETGRICVCPRCSRPTFFEVDIHTAVLSGQTPPPADFRPIQHLPDVVDELWHEVLRCHQAGAPTAVALLCRKLVMNVAVEKGDVAGRRFAEYVQYLASLPLLPADVAEAAFTRLRELGNAATHKHLAPTTGEDAVFVLAIAEQVLRTFYELPAQLGLRPTEDTSSLH